MTEMIRTFVALELPALVRSHLSDVQLQLKSERAGRFVRWVPAGGIHLTLKFLGDVDAAQMTALQAAVTTACRGARPFQLALGSAGAFPNVRRPSVIWVGLEGDVAAAGRLAERIDAECAGLGFPRETRPFTAHLTLGRVKRDTRPVDQQAVGGLLAAAVIEHSDPLAAERVSIMKSELRPSGSVYTCLHAIDLADPE